MEERLLQPSKAPPPIEVTLLGIVMVVKLLQFRKASMQIEVTLLGIGMVVKLLQPEKAPTPIEIILLGMMVFLHPVIKVFVEDSIIALQLFRES